MKLKIQLHFTNKDIAILSLLSGLWALTEINLGLFLRAFKLPFSGALLTFLGLVILFLAKDAVPQKGTAILVGILTAYLKLFFLGGLAFFPIIAILVESFLVEISLISNHNNRTNTIIAGVLAMCWSLIHPFFTQGLLSGWGMSRVYETFFKRSTEILGISSQSIFSVILVVIFVHFLLGILASIVGLKLTRQIYFLSPSQIAHERYQNL